MYKTVKPTFKDKRDHNIAQVKLAFLKQNYGYQKFFLSLKKDPYSQCPQFRKPSESYEEYRKRISLLKCEPPALLKDSLNHFGINYDFVSSIQIRGLASTIDLLNLLDPQREISDISSKKLLSELPLLFYSPSLFALKPSRGWVEEPDLLPHERFLKLDLRKGKTQLISDLNHYLQHEFELYEVGSKGSFEAFYWEINTESDQKAAWSQLEVWKLRKKQIRRRRKSFKEIARIQKSNQDAVKKRFYRAYKRIHGEPYDSVLFNKIAKEINKGDLPKLCEICSDQNCLDKLKRGQDWIPCPDIQDYIDQDQVQLKEKLLDEGSDAFREHLLFKQQAR